MEMKSRFVQLCVNTSIWRMVVILRLGHIQVKGKLLGIMIGICREGRQNFGDQRKDVHKEL